MIFIFFWKPSSRPPSLCLRFPRVRGRTAHVLGGGRDDEEEDEDSLSTASELRPHVGGWKSVCGASWRDERSGTSANTIKLINF